MSTDRIEELARESERLHPVAYAVFVLGEHEEHIDPWSDIFSTRVQADAAIMEMKEENFGEEYEIVPLYASPPAEAAPTPALTDEHGSLAPGLCVMTSDDGNAYSEILRLLGMEEEGDPVAKVRELVAALPPSEVREEGAATDKCPFPRVGPEAWARLVEAQKGLETIDKRIGEISERYGLASPSVATGQVPAFARTAADVRIAEAQADAQELAKLREENDEDERADNMDRAASMLTWMLLTHPLYAALPQGTASAAPLSIEQVRQAGVRAMEDAVIASLPPELRKP